MSYRYCLFLILIFIGGSPVFAGNESVRFHSVQKGESIFSISKKYGTTPAELMRMNHLANPRKIKVGQKLKIPGASLHSVPAIVREVEPQGSVLEAPDRYVVQRGEDYPEIARKFRLQEGVIRTLNHGVELEPGVVLVLKTKGKAPVKKEGSFFHWMDDEEQEESSYLFIGSVKHLIDMPKITKGRWRYIVVHHSATSSGNAAIFDLAHHQRGMENGLAYHFVIGNGKDSKDGEIEVGNRWLKQLQGGHLRSEELNQVAIGICLVGNFEEVRPTRRQQAALIELISYLREKIGKPYPEFKVHREINPMPTSCPGRNFPIQALHRIFDE